MNQLPEHNQSSEEEALLKDARKLWSKYKSVLDADERQQLLDYYNESLHDYDDWSRNRHMHFGFYPSWSNPFARENMLEEMSLQVLKRLALPGTDRTTSNQRVLDMGCGLGGTCRVGADQYNHTQFYGISLVPAQVDKATELKRNHARKDNIRFLCADYTSTPFGSDSFNGAWAIESSCYASGLDKYDFLMEAHRLLKPGARLVVADGFLKNHESMGRVLRYSHKRLCESWAFTTLADLGAFTRRMKKIGFTDIEVEDISWRVAPSFAFIPFVAINFLVKELLFKGRKFNKVNWGHVAAPFYAILLGLSRKYFGYYLVTARKA